MRDKWIYNKSRSADVLKILEQIKRVEKQVKTETNIHNYHNIKPSQRLKSSRKDSILSEEQLKRPAIDKIRPSLNSFFNPRHIDSTWMST